MITNFNDFKIFEAFISSIDSYTSFQNILKYKNKKNIYIHFTDLNKLGVNPKKGHHDPYGIYFYPENFIIDQINEGTDFQYGFSMKYYFICQVDISNFLNLNKIKNIDDINKIFKQAGYLDIFHKINFGDIKGRYDQKFWKVLDSLNVSPEKRTNLKNIPQIKWNTFFSKLSYDGLIDNKSVINGNEPEQIVVFNKKTIKILESGENKISRNNFNQILDIIKEKLPTHSIKYKYVSKNNNVTTDFFIDDKIKIVFNHDISNYTIYYVKDSILKTENVNFNIFGVKKEFFIEKIIYYISKYIDIADDVNINDYFNDNFYHTLSNIIKFINPTKIFYDKNIITYQNFDYGFLKIVYDTIKKKFIFEFYPVDSNQMLFYNFEFYTIDEFKNKFLNRTKQLIDDKYLNMNIDDYYKFIGINLIL